MYFDWILWLALIIFLLAILVSWPEAFYVLWRQVLHHREDEEDLEEMYDTIDRLFGPARPDPEGTDFDTDEEKTDECDMV